MIFRLIEIIRKPRPTPQSRKLHVGMRARQQEKAQSHKRARAPRLNRLVKAN
jgi:hypothetical protein